MLARVVWRLHVCVIFTLGQKKEYRDDNSAALARCVTSPVGAALLHCASGLIV